MTTTTAPLQPLIIPADRIVRQPVARWQQNLCRNLVSTLSAADGDMGEIAPSMNQLALLEAYQGNNANALQLCEAQIHFWKNFAQQHSNPKQVCLAVQPWINLIRLDRWQNRVDRSTSLYTELAPQARDAQNSLSIHFGLDFSFNQLCQLDPANLQVRLIDNIYWMEYGRQLLACDDHGTLQAHIQDGLKQPLSRFLKLVLLELLFMYQYKLGKFEKALALLDKLEIDRHSSFWLPLKVLEMALHLRLGSAHAPALLEQVMQAIESGRYFKKDGQSLYLLFELCRVCKNFGLSQQEPVLLDMTRELATALNDEVILFEVMHRQAQLQLLDAEQVRQRFSHSLYGVVQKKLGTATQQPPQQARRCANIVSATRHMAELDFGACIAILNQEFALTELSAA